MLSVLVGAILMSGENGPAKALEDWGRETLRTIRQNYYMPEKKLYGDSIVPGETPKQVAFNWGCGVMLSALNAAARTDKKYDSWLREFADSTHTYWNPLPPVPGYDVLPAPKPVDRYYDDNQWMVMGLVETYEHLGDRKYLGWAQDALTFALSGESDDLGGGIFWKETEKTSKNTCSNSPAAAACLAVYHHTNDRKLLLKAQQLYSWTKRHLQDPKDHLMWDSINLKGKIEPTKWTYNTALMIRTASELYALTKLPSYADDALAMEQASVAKWYSNGALHDAGRFAHLLMEAWLIRRKEVPGDTSTDAAVQALMTLHQSSRSPEGLYPDRWDAKPPIGNHKVELIDQASVARADFVLAEYLRRK